MVADVLIMVQKVSDEVQVEVLLVDIGNLVVVSKRPLADVKVHRWVVDGLVVIEVEDLALPMGTKTRRQLQRAMCFDSDAQLACHQVRSQLLYHVLRLPTQMRCGR